MNRLRVYIMALVLTGVVTTVASAGQSSIGGGLHYLRNLADIQDEPDIEWDENSFGIIGSYQYNAGLLKFEGDVEYIMDYAGSDESMFIPSAWLLAGGLIYGGAGIGIGYIDGDWQSDPFYALRAGVDFPLSSFHLDLFGTYQFQKDDDLENLTGEDLDSVTFAAILRFNIGGD